MQKTWMPLWLQKLSYWLLAALIVVLVVLYAKEFRYFENTFDVRRLVFTGMTIGALAGGFLGWRLQKTAKDSVEKTQVFLLLFVPFVLFMPLLVSLTNRWFATQPVENQQFEFWEQTTRLSNRFGLIKDEKPRPDIHYIFFLRNGEIERIKMKTPLQGVKRSDQIQLPVRRGLWGFEWVEI